MTRTEINALESASRTAMAWTPSGYDGETHLRGIGVATASALAIVFAAATLLVAVI